MTITQAAGKIHPKATSMYLIIIKIALPILLLTAASYVIACAQETSINLKPQGSEIIFADPEQGAWTKVYFSNNHLHQQLFQEENTYFDESTDSDFSENKKYLKINKITRGTIDSDTGEEEYDRAYCAFIEMGSGCIVRQETGSFCGGAWAETGNSWVWAGEEIIIDERDPHKALSESDVEILSEIGGAANVSRCIKPKS